MNIFFINQKIKNLISIISFIIFIIILIVFYNKNKNANNILNNNETYEKYYYDVKNFKKNEIGLLNENNTQTILNSTNMTVKNQILNLIKNYNNNFDINFYDDNKEYIYELLNNKKVLFLGDSNTEHFLFYNLLDEKYFKYMTGLSVNKQSKKIEEYLTDDIETIVFFNGYNFDEYKTVEEYINSYENIIKIVKNKLKNCKIYILSIIPASLEKIKEDLKSPIPHNIFMGKEFDIGLENHNFYDATYIDTKWIVRENFNKDDGVHMIDTFYKILIPYVSLFINL